MTLLKGQLFGGSLNSDENSLEKSYLQIIQTCSEDEGFLSLLKIIVSEYYCAKLII